MNWYQNSANNKHKIFVSYYHKDDQYYRNEFERRFSHLFVSKSVEPGDIDSDLSDEYIKRLIQEGYLTDSSVVLVLVGLKTYCRKHVDWEISAGLNKKVGGYSGLVGILLPEYPLSADNKYSYSNIPPRLADNLKSDYAEIYTWDFACQNEATIKNVIQTAFDNRLAKSDKINNSRNQYTQDLCD
ncbi:MAG: TIR domain-containing protein [Candidatus Thiodiazotropha sp.]|nr:TIR domain-containing protein [Candidatus Thiodiazotropha sp.]MCM8920634.1 TIR domain-containing protein [Candidatus Thiodiazotropha sp.]